MGRAMRWPVLCLLLAASAVAGTPDDTGYFQVVQAVAPHVWVLREPRFQLQPIGNVTVVEQADGIVLVDAGGSPGSGRRIVDVVRKLSPKPVKAVILSQWHGDKVQGLSEILKAWPAARTIATEATKAHLSDPATMNSPATPDAERNAKLLASIAGTAAAMREGAAKATEPQEREGFARAAAMFDQYGRDMDGALTLAPREGFAGTFDLPDATAPVQALFMGRADTDGDAVVWLPRQKVLVAGEIVILPFPYGYECYPAEWITVLDKLRGFDFRFLVPGHGAPQTDRVQIDRIAAVLKDARAQVAPLAAQGLPLAEVQAKVDLSVHAKALCGPDAWCRRWFKAFFVDPVIVSAFKEAKGEPILQNLGG